MIDHCLPLVVADADTPAEAVAQAHRALRRLPKAVCELLWTRRYGLYVKRAFDWPGAGNNARWGHPWSDTGGYWSASTGYAVINAARCRSQDSMDAVVCHEIGHALSLHLLAKPHRSPAFRAGWTRGRKRIKARFPAAYAARAHIGIFCGHWAAAVEEVWAECFTWLMEARAEISPEFGNCFPECLELVQAELAILMEPPA